MFIRDSLKIGILMDAIETIKTYKDSTFAMMLSAQSRGHKLFYFQQQDLYVSNGISYTKSNIITVSDSDNDYYHLGDDKYKRLSEFDVILMRKDPPFNMEYVYSTYILEMAEREGTLVVNPSKSLRSVNEKFYINYFPDLTPNTLVTRNMDKVRSFIELEGKAVVKPMDGMGGKGIFKITKDDANINAILESLGNGNETIMVQSYIDKVIEGDKRILIIDGEPVKYGLARIPQGKDFRANLAAGGIGEVQALTKHEFDLCERIKPIIKKLSLLFVGLDVIGGYITEINITSPTCIREIEAEKDICIADRLIEVIEKKCLS